jgi:hypothetical protein
VLDVASVPADPGNRSLSLISEPVLMEDVLRVELEIRRDTASPESVPLVIDTGGLVVREDVLVEGELFRWEQDIPLSPGEAVTHAGFSLPADTNSRDHRVAVAWQDAGLQLAGGDGLGPGSLPYLRASVLPETGVREWQSTGAPGPNHVIWMTDRDLIPETPLDFWVREGGLLIQWPDALQPVQNPEEAVPLEVSSWDETQGVLATRRRDPLRMDLLEIFRVEDLPEDDDVQVLARLSDGRPLLTRRTRGQGRIYRWATLPGSGFSNLSDGFVLVPVMQRLFAEASRLQGETGTRELGNLMVERPEGWQSLDDPEADIRVDAGRYRNGSHVLAQNRPLIEDQPEALSVEELSEWAQPFSLQVFADRSDAAGPSAARSELTGLLALLGLALLVVESWLLTRNIRKTPASPAAWKGVRA